VEQNALAKIKLVEHLVYLHNNHTDISPEGIVLGTAMYNISNPFPAELISLLFQ
jgi:hypothetical protein